MSKKNKGYGILVNPQKELVDLIEIEVDNLNYVDSFEIVQILSIDTYWIDERIGQTEELINEGHDLAIPEYSSLFSSQYLFEYTAYFECDEDNLPVGRTVCNYLWKPYDERDTTKGRVLILSEDCQALAKKEAQEFIETVQVRFM